jgi:hypothetical protein
MRATLIAVAAAAALTGVFLVQARAYDAGYSINRIYAADMPQAERDAKNENFNPALVAGSLREDGSRRIEWRHKMVRQAVVVEGIALGEAPENPSHMTTQRVAYEGGRIFIRGVDFKKAGAEGKLVRVSGVLMLSPEARASFGTISDQYFYIQADKIQLLDRATDPLLMAPGLK